MSKYYLERGCEYINCDMDSDYYSSEVYTINIITDKKGIQEDKVEVYGDEELRDLIIELLNKHNENKKNA